MKNLRDLRLKLGVSLKDLGSIFGLAESTISLYETGKRQPDNETLIKLADYFNVSTDYLLGRTDEQKEIRPSNELDERINNLAKENSNIYKLIDFFSQLDPSKQQTLIDLAEAYIAKQNQDKKQ